MWGRSHPENRTRVAKEGTQAFGRLRWSGAGFQNGAGDNRGMARGGEVSKGGSASPHPRALWIVAILYNMVTGLIQQGRVHEATRKMHAQESSPGRKIIIRVNLGIRGRWVVTLSLGGLVHQPASPARRWGSQAVRRAPEPPSERMGEGRLSFFALQ